MDEEKLQNWLDGMAGMIIWMKEHGYSPEEALETLSHDVHGTNATLYQGMTLFMPRSSGYRKYCPDETKKASE